MQLLSVAKASSNLNEVPTPEPNRIRTRWQNAAVSGFRRQCENKGVFNDRIELISVFSQDTCLWQQQWPPSGACLRPYTEMFCREPCTSVLCAAGLSQEEKICANVSPSLPRRRVFSPARKRPPTPTLTTDATPPQPAPELKHAADAFHTTSCFFGRRNERFGATLR